MSKWGDIWLIYGLYMVIIWLMVFWAKKQCDDMEIMFLLMVLAEQTYFGPTNEVLLMWTSAAYVGTAKGDVHQHT